MDPNAALSTSAQIAVAIAGFAGVVVAVRSESVHNWGRVEKFWLRLLLVNSILPLTFSMVGLLIFALPALNKRERAVPQLRLLQNPSKAVDPTSYCFERAQF